MYDPLSKFTNMSQLDRFSALIEIAIFAMAFYLILRFLHGTRGLGIMKGILAIIVILIVAFILFPETGGGAGSFYLPRLKLVADEFLTVVVLSMIIVFQPEVRRGLSRIGEVGFFGKGEMTNLNPITQAAVRMGRKKIGALIVIQGNTGLAAYTEGAAKVNAKVSASLLESIFFPNSPLHDGAVLIHRNRIVAACCLLPLSEKPDLPPGMGTRHRAALGITEESDAVAVVVSEETGKMNIAFRGEIVPTKDAKELELRLGDYLYESTGRQGESAA